MNIPEAMRFLRATGKRITTATRPVKFVPSPRLRSPAKRKPLRRTTLL